jgi:hypothetical protein
MTITPTAGQTAEQTAADQGACETEAAAQTGYHPSQPAPTMQPTQPVAGQRLAGAARGAAVGAVREQRTDAEDREVEDVTEAGARAGAVAGGVRQRQGRRESRRDAAQEQQAQAQLESAYSEAFRACMTTKDTSSNNGSAATELTLALLFFELTWSPISQPAKEGLRLRQHAGLRLQACQPEQHFQDLSSRAAACMVAATRKGPPATS